MDQFAEDNFVVDKLGGKTVELIGATFLADEDHVFGLPNHDYIAREIKWYESQSRFVKDIPEGPPHIWEKVSSSAGMINSNYGWMIWSPENGSQYDNVLNELKKNPFSRRAEMIYTRPSMWVDYNADGMSDFVCTEAVQYFIRGEKLISHVKMRSNDGIFGYRNDFAWQKHVQNKLANDLGVEAGDMIWTAGSFHIYDSHFYLIDHYAKTGETHITKAKYDQLYGV
jgi:thymidylate synthase